MPRTKPVPVPKGQKPKIRIWKEELEPIERVVKIGKHCMACDSAKGMNCKWPDGSVTKELMRPYRILNHFQFGEDTHLVLCGSCTKTLGAKITWR
jgi:glycine cleavage system protein P-like pyridoxal-binding family